MLGRPDLSFKSQREALGQAAEAAPTSDIYGQAMQSAQSLLNTASGIGFKHKTANVTGISPEILKELWDGRNSGIQSEIDKTNEQINKLHEGNAENVANINMSERATQLTQLAMKHGFSPSLAQAFVLNMQDESGLRNDVVEGTANIHGTKGQGLFQLTDVAEGKGRRSDYLNFMKTNGRNDYWSDDSQMAFAWFERNGSEKANWDRVEAMNGVGNQASGIVQHVLRPAKEHRIARQNKYLALGY